MRIAVVHNLKEGGAHRRLASQVERFDAEVIEFCLQTARPVTGAAVIGALRPLAPGSRRVLRPPMRYVDLAMIERAWERLCRQIDLAGVDVVYANPCQRFQAPPALGRVSVPALYFCDEVRRVDAEPEARAMRNRLSAPIYAPIYRRERRIDRAASARATAIVTNSRYTASQIAHFYGREATVVRQGVADTIRTAGPHAGAGEFLLSVGSLIPSKGHDLVVRAAARTTSRPPVRVVAPRPEPAEQQRLSNLARELSIDLQIRIGVSDRELGDLYDDALATLYLSVREPLGLVSLEAQAQGCPVIVAREGGLPETIVEGETGWSAPRDPALVAPLVDRLSDPDVRRRMSLAGRAHAAEWTWENSAAHVECLLRHLAYERRDVTRLMPTR